MSVNAILAFALIVFVFGFPKSGNFVGGVPVSTGYLVFALYVSLLLFRRVHGRAQNFPINAQYIGLLALLNGLVIVLFAAINGVVDFSAFFSYLIGFSLIPFALLVLSGRDLVFDRIFLKTICYIIRFVCLYGLFLFVFFLLNGYFFEIPYLTVTGGEGGLMEKNNIRGGGISKFFSTYNNGNIFGVCLLIVLPLYDRLETSILWRALIRLALVLTFSRTVWFVMIIYEVLASKASITLKIVSTSILLLGVYFLLSGAELNANFIFDASMGGRYETIQQASFDGVLGKPFEFISEVTYVSVYYVSGILGLLMTVVLLSGSAIVLFRSTVKRTPARACAIGMILYLIASCSDGAALLPPVMMIYWLIFWFGVNQVQGGHAGQY